ncbi:hypothetical protein LCGC14_1730910 [marine sediment metagenome]|uniref:Uncharacterized protein n=1 Tax=marine sediment metagenome TaxID=412755 RepID=A0A0F9K9B1_9ZZZZ
MHGRTVAAPAAEELAMSEDDYIDCGDKVQVIEIKSINGSSSDKSLLGQAGVVVASDGWGLCMVKFGDGKTDRFWNVAQLERIGP